MADMFLGRIQGYQEGTQVVNGVAVGGYPKGHWQMTDLEPYIQDDWKFTPHLTFNLGVRYYIYTRIHDVSRPTVDSGFEPNEYTLAGEDPLNASGNYVYPATGATAGNFGNGLVECGYNGVPKGCQLNNTAGNIAPRLGFAWDPTGTGKTSIRGGWGLYFESGNGNEAQTEGGEGNPPVAPGPEAYNILGYGSIQPSGLLVPSPTGFTSVPHSESWPSVQQYSFTIEHEFSGGNLVSIAYVGALGRHLARAQDINEVNPSTIANGGTINAPALAGLGGNKAAANGAPGDVGEQLCDASGNCNVADTLINEAAPNLFFRPYVGWAGITQKSNSATSSYSALQTSLRHSFSHGLTLQAAYTWSHAIDNSTSTYESSSFGEVDDYDLDRWKATGDINRTNVLQMNYIYAIPFFKNSSSGFSRAILGGWQISGIGSFFTGEPIDFGCGVNGFSTALGGVTRCDVVGKVAIDKGTWDDPVYGPTATWWNPATVAQPQFSQMYANGESGMFGNMGRNLLTGPGRNNFDTALEKNFSLPWFKGEHSTLQFRLETFNTFNHTQWQYVNSGCSGANPFGAACNGNTTQPGEVNATWAPRQIQLGAKLMF